MSSHDAVYSFVIGGCAACLSELQLYDFWRDWRFMTHPFSKGSAVNDDIIVIVISASALKSIMMIMTSGAIHGSRNVKTFHCDGAGI